MNDLTNKKYGLLTAIEIVGKKGKNYLWKCHCDCGGEKIVPAPYLLNGHTKSCGCLGKKIRDNVIKAGDRYGRLIAVEFVEYAAVSSGKKRAVWKFRCDCGNEKNIPVSDVKFSNVRSCGCMLKEHASVMNTEDITGQIFGRLKAICPTKERTKNGSVVWELACECGNTVYKTVNELKTGRVLSCGCLYKESRKDCVTYRKDIIENTSISSIVASKKLSEKNTSGHTGVCFDKRNGKWYAYINYQKKRYFLGYYKNIDDAIAARKESEIQLHDPVVMEYFNNLTVDRKKEFIEYMKNNGMAVDIKQNTVGEKQNG